MPRSILTEKLGRRGYHLTREYGVDPLELVLVRDVMSIVPESRTAHAASPFYAYADRTTRGAAEIMAAEGLETLPVMDRTTGQVIGELSRKIYFAAEKRLHFRESERLRLFGYVPPEQTGHT